MTRRESQNVINRSEISLASDLSLIGKNFLLTSDQNDSGQQLQQVQLGFHCANNDRRPDVSSMMAMGSKFL